VATLLVQSISHQPVPESNVFDICSRFFGDGTTRLTKFMCLWKFKWFRVILSPFQMSTNTKTQHPNFMFSGLPVIVHKSANTMFIYKYNNNADQWVESWSMTMVLGNGVGRVRRKEVRAPHPLATPPTCRLRILRVHTLYGTHKPWLV
jgi:hypothetical protein